MSKWTWPMCDECWRKRFPWDPVRLKMVGMPPERCGWCGGEAKGGIFIRANPADVPFRDDDP